MVVVRRLKYEMCKNWREKGECKYGDRCLFAHGDTELTKRTSQYEPEPEKGEPQAPEKVEPQAPEPEQFKTPVKELKIATREFESGSTQATDCKDLTKANPIVEEMKH